MSRRITADAFWARVDTTGGQEACWPYRSSRNAKGYGTIGKRDKAHRRAWTLTHGPIPIGQWVLHRCNNPPCCNPAHLYVGYRLENARDMVAAGHAVGRSAPGSLNHNAKLHESDIPVIRDRIARGHRLGAIADNYGVSHAAIWLIAKGRQWRHA